MARILGGTLVERHLARAGGVNEHHARCRWTAQGNGLLIDDAHALLAAHGGQVRILGVVRVSPIGNAAGPAM